MRNMNENVSFAGKVKAKAADLVSKALIRQADDGIKFSVMIIVSEPKVPVELMCVDKD